MQCSSKAKAQWSLCTPPAVSLRRLAPTVGATRSLCFIGATKLLSTTVVFWISAGSHEGESAVRGARESEQHAPLAQARGRRPVDLRDAAEDPSAAEAPHQQDRGGNASARHSARS
eukprot:5296959-Pleurochrysis_carterae.AAC.5